MRDWIVGYEKGASQKRPGVSEQEWTEAEQALGEAPEELRDLYHAFNGATFGSGVHLFPLRAEGPHRGLLEESRISVAGLPDTGLWRFGEKGSKHLFALVKSAALELDNAPRPDWLLALDEDVWVFGVKDELTQVVKLYKSLDVLLSTLIPPAESEEFGERTYARAMTLVQSALDNLEDEAPTAIRPAKAQAPKAAKKPTAKPAAVKSVKKAVKAPVKKAAVKPVKKKAVKVPAKKAAKKAAVKPVKKKAVKAPAKKAAKKAAKKSPKRGARRKAH